ncbi:hypothetical protein A9Q84_08390 [Halobacteriovorax marinus]|uniref:Secreted protein n=1 Tax=Halobacteriovorax marinus TaxID=97084 RepID=A0A1Y5F6E4_9BACT|nr:hypothetical protein A9Q84_08390 [Halobacteriovorax marinus]
MKWSLLSTFIFLIAFQASAEGYKAPDIKIARHPDHSGQVVQEGQWESGYKVEEKSIPDRDVASEEDEQPMKKRGPSSERTPSSKIKKPGVEPWPFDPSSEN